MIAISAQDKPLCSAYGVITESTTGGNKGQPVQNIKLHITQPHFTRHHYSPFKM